MIYVSSGQQLHHVHFPSPASLCVWHTRMVHPEALWSLLLFYRWITSQTLYKSDNRIRRMPAQSEEYSMIFSLAKFSQTEIVGSENPLTAFFTACIFWQRNLELLSFNFYLSAFCSHGGKGTFPCHWLGALEQLSQDDAPWLPWDNSAVLNIILWPLKQI